LRTARINIIGASGVGKTTLGRALADHLGIPHFDSDAYYHLPTDPPYRVQREPHERCALLERDLGAHVGWILSGGAGTWRPAPALRYTLHVFLWLPCELRIERLRRRERELYGERIAPGGDMAADHAAFMEWTRGYDDGTAEGTNTLACHEELLRAAPCPVVRLSAALPLRASIDLVLAQLAAGSPASEGRR